MSQHRHLRVYTKSGSVYLFCANTHKWLRLYCMPDAPTEHLSMEGTFPIEWEPTLDQEMSLQREGGVIGDKYNPDVIRTTEVVAIEEC